MVLSLAKMMSNMKGYALSQQFRRLTVLSNAETTFEATEELVDADSLSHLMVSRWNFEEAGCCLSCRMMVVSWPSDIRLGKTTSIRPRKPPKRVETPSHEFWPREYMSVSREEGVGRDQRVMGNVTTSINLIRGSRQKMLSESASC